MAYKTTISSGCSFLATKSTSKTAQKNSKQIIGATSCVWLVALLVMIIKLSQMIPPTNALPQSARSMIIRSEIQFGGRMKFATTRNATAQCPRKLKRRTNKNAHFCTVEKVQEIFPDPVAWANPCQSDGFNPKAKNSKNRNVTNLDNLKRHLNLMLNDNCTTKYDSCVITNKTTNTSTNWCAKRKQYAFFELGNETDKLCLRLEHKRLQVYIAGLEYLNRFDRTENDCKLDRIVQFAKTLLCEIETAINQTACRPPPPPLSKHEMCMRLNLNSLTSPDETYIDVIWAHYNFGRHLRILRRKLNKRSNITNCSRRRNFHSSNTKESNKGMVGKSKPNQRPKHRPLSGKKPHNRIRANRNHDSRRF